MGSRTHTSRGHHTPSGNPRRILESPAADEWYQAGGFQQGKNITNGQRSDLTRGGGSSFVSPGGGEYLSGAPREYTNEAYSDQGFGKKTRARPNWRTEDKIFGPEGIGNEPPATQQYTGIGPRGYRRSDARIREDACEALSDDLYVDASDIEVSVENGEITLTGTVKSRDEKRRAGEVLEYVRGMTDVHNRIRLA